MFSRQLGFPYIRSITISYNWLVQQSTCLSSTMDSFTKPDSLFGSRRGSGSSSTDSSVNQPPKTHSQPFYFPSFPSTNSITDEHNNGLHQVPSFIHNSHSQTFQSNILVPLPRLQQSNAPDYNSAQGSSTTVSPLLQSATPSLDSLKSSSTTSSATANTQNTAPPNRAESSTPSGSSTASGKGITSLIRIQLNFTDPLKWKKFTNRRLELIDKFNLSSRKASEQDDLILKIADILRTEFNYKEDTLYDFDKLVRAAVQSVRRNRKRLAKTEFNYKEDTLYDFDKLVRAAVQSVRRNRKRLAKLSEIRQDERQQQQQQQQTIPISSAASLDHENNATDSLPSGLNTPTTKHPKFISYDFNTNTNTDPTYNETRTSTSSNSNASSTFNTNVTNSPSSSLPSMSSQPMKLPPITPEPFNFSESNKKKLLNYITNSSTFFNLIDSPTSVNENMILTLGQNSINATVSFTLEKLFSTVHQSSLSYLYTKLTSIESLSHFFKSLEINNSSSQSVHLLSENQSMNLLFKIVGCLIKDYGFDTICYTLGELFHELILLEYPLYIATSKSTTIPQQQQQVSSIMPLLPLNPKEADEEIQKVITIKYRTQSIQMKFKPLSSTPPTYLELLENCKVLFNVSDKSLRLRFVDENIGDLAGVFKDLNKMNLVIEVYDI
ncbi:hypothetical protein WICPIJ_005389 [Wickerhamomyces pijperi]|uniref:Uncharacterized protein n=1 Tax=Wickerhamomyces pijperi TaxID=599730 RepID=A0A9P8TM00_WICPI|nr:hypothetical protein WICPIJ_005389 [Wickerhamomyces pijperi]